MELKQLGNTNMKVPEIGLGVWKYRGGVEPFIVESNSERFLSTQRRCTALKTLLVKPLKAFVTRSLLPPKFQVATYVTTMCLKLPTLA